MTAHPDRLDTDALRERAVSLARSRWDVGYLWELISSIPTAEAAAGRPEAGAAGLDKASALFGQLLAEREGDTELREALRPLYLAYLRKHGCGCGG